MTEQEKKTKLEKLENELALLRHKKKRYQFQLDGVTSRMEEILEEIKKIS